MGIKETKEKVEILSAYINNILINLELDSDVEWSEEEETKKGLEQLIQGSKSSGMLLKELSDEENIFVMIYDKEDKMDYSNVKDILKSELFPRDEPVGKKLKKELHILYRVSDVSVRIKRENILNEKKNKIDLKKSLNEKNREQFYSEFKSIKIYYICDTEPYKEEIFLDGINRFDVLQMPENKENINQFNASADIIKEVGMTGYVLTVQLKQLVEIYNKIGDVLFKSNVRYGLEEQFGVNEAIKDTLKREPQKFWFRNNGVTIIVKNSNFILDKSSKITLSSKEEGEYPGFSVINGAQTITTSAEYYYKLKSSEQTSEVKEELEHFEQVKVLLRLIHFKAKDEEKTREVNEVSVALNRQKPIKSEDIAYTAPQVAFMLEYMNENKASEFILVKRGEKNITDNRLSLVDIARAMKAVKQKPGEARNKVAARLLEQDPKTRCLKDEEIFPDFKGEISELENTYKWVYFAHSIVRQYTKVYKKLNEGLDEHEVNILNNGKWYFVSYLIYCLSDKEIQEKIGQFNTVNDRKSLISKLCRVIESKNAEQEDVVYLKLLIRVFVQELGKIIGSIEAKADETRLKIKQVNSNTFKSDKLFEFILDGHDVGMKAKITEILDRCVNDSVAEKKEDSISSYVNKEENGNNKDNQFVGKVNDRVRIKVVEIKETEGVSKRIYVKGTKEALQESVIYIAEKYPKMRHYINDIPWITEDQNGNRFEIINLWGKTYYLNTNAGSKEMKKRLSKLLEIMKLPSDTVCWYEEGEKIPY